MIQQIDNGVTRTMANYKIIKRDGKKTEFDINKISNAMKKAFEATNTDYTDTN